MKILTNKEIEFLLNYYRQILNLTTSTSIMIECRYYMSQVRVWRDCPYYNYEDTYEESN